MVLFHNCMDDRKEIGMTLKLHRLANLDTWRHMPAYAVYVGRKLLASRLCRRLVVPFGHRWTGMKALSVGDQNDNFFHFGWETLSFMPPADHLVNIRYQPLPFKDSSIDLVNASHVIEHLRDSELDYFLSEVYRVLSPTGTFRIVVPDLEGFIESYYSDGLAKHYEWPSAGSSMREYKEQEVRVGRENPAVLLPHNGLISIVASYTNGHPLPIASKEDVEEHLRNGDIDHFVHWCVSLKDTSKDDFGHFNGFTFDRLNAFLKRCGFTVVIRSVFGETGDIRLFRGIDRAVEKTVSLYVNAQK